MSTGRSDSRQRHRPVDFVAECDGLEDFLCARTVGNASRLDPALQGRAGDTLQDQALDVADCWNFESKRHLDVFKQLSYLRLWKTNDQPSEARQESVLVTGLHAHPRQKIRTDHLQAITSRFVAPKHQSCCF